MAPSSQQVMYGLLLILFDVIYCIQINTKLGYIDGITENRVHKFLNIPYAEPPIGELRWRATQPLKNTWKGVYNATKFGNICVQPTMVHAFNYDPTRSDNEQSTVSEDCLYLNVYTPYDFNKKESESESLRPVFFWIHGGGLEMGTAMVPFADGSIFASDQDIVIVTINYRLHRAAWMIDPLLYDSPTGNGGATGFLDMIRALKWTKANIESFGGNPNEITIGGESGGGWAVCGLVLSPLAKGLFIRSIQMSGSCIKSSGRFLTKREAYKQTKKACDVIGVKSFEELRAMDMQDIVDAGYGNTELTTLPSTDGYVFPMDTIDLISAGHVNGESTMIGTLFLESFSVEPFYMGSLKKTEKELNEYYFENFFDSEVAEIQRYYPFNDLDKIWRFKSVFNTTSEIIQTTQHTDCWVRCGSIAQTEILSTNLMTKRSFPVYFYQYGYIEEPWDQVTHGYDEQCLFGHRDISPLKFSQNSDEFNKITMKFFGEYIKGIGPINLNDNNKPVTIQNNYYLRIVDDIKIVDLSELDIVKQRCKLWELWGNHASDNSAICFGINTETEQGVTVEIQEFFDKMENNDTLNNE